MSDTFPVDVHQFLREHIRTFAQLELLLLVHRTPEKSWTVEEAAKQLYIPVGFARSILEILKADGIVAVKEGGQRNYQFAPKSSDLGQLIDDLARLYRERPVTTIHAIHTESTEALQNFADAFRIRKKEHE